MDLRLTPPPDPRAGITSTEKLYLWLLAGLQSAPTPTTCRAIFSPRSLVIETTTQYSQLSPRSGAGSNLRCRIADSRPACGSAFAALKRR